MIRSVKPPGKGCRSVIVGGPAILFQILLKIRLQNSKKERKTEKERGNAQDYTEFAVLSVLGIVSHNVA